MYHKTVGLLLIGVSLFLNGAEAEEDRYTGALKNLGSYLALSAELGDFQDLKDRIAQGTDVNQQDAEGFTALYIACEKGNAPMALYLLDQGADPRIVPEMAFGSPLLKAIEHGMYPVCKSILRTLCVQLLPTYDQEAYALTSAFFSCMPHAILPREVMLRVVEYAPDLRLGVAKMIFSDPHKTLEQKLALVRSILGKDAATVTLRDFLLPRVSAFVMTVPYMESRTAPVYAQELCRHDANQQREQICELLKQDTFRDRLYELIEECFFS